ncbi:MAG: DUF2939 domain-containing protein [Alphaproteobacteria bacterium]|nr:DUF2939 domain-containing protein [Alphaproteobacteria bacterium]
MKRLLFLIFLLAIGFYVVWPSLTGYRIYQGLETNRPEVLAAKIDFPSVRQSMRGPVMRQVNTRIETVMRDLGPATSLIAERIPKDNIEKVIDGALESVVTPEKIVEIYGNDGDFNAAIKQAVLVEIEKMGGLAAVLKIDHLFDTATAGTGDDKTGSREEGELRIGGIKVPDKWARLLKEKNVDKLVGGVAAKIGLDPEKLTEKLFPAAEDEPRLRAASGRKGGYGFDNIKSFGFAGPFAMNIGVARSAARRGPDVTAEIAFRNYDWRITKMTPNLLDRT